ncbi:MAG: TolC family protein [Pseudomonadota bacterium]
MRSPRLIAATATLLLLAGCTVGPDHVPPEPELPETFVESPVGDVTDYDDVGALWAVFDEPELAALIARARERNLTLAEAAAVRDETRALSGLRIFSLFPTITAEGNRERVTQAEDDPFAFPFGGVAERNLFGFDMAWEIDLFGNLRRQAEGIVRRDEADTAAFYAAELSIVAETAQAYFAWRGAALRIALLEKNLANQADNLDILERAFEAGSGTSLDVARARALERSVAATLPGAKFARTQAEQRLAVLTAQTPANVRAQLTIPTGMPVMPELRPVGTPAAWLARRPDVIAAERRLAEAVSGVGVETAQLYPKLELLGSFGWTGVSESAIGQGSGERWRFAPTLSWRFLDYGRVKRNIQAAEARAEAAYARFEQSWRLALEETENALANYRATSETVATLEVAVSEAEDASGLARLRYDNGADSFLAVLDAERTSLDLQDQLAVATTDRATALAALYKALGGSFVE